MRSYGDTEAYRKALKKRAVWVEPLFAEAKDWHRLRRFRLRGLEKVNTEALLSAAGQKRKEIGCRSGSWSAALRTGSSFAPYHVGGSIGPSIQEPSPSFSSGMQAFFNTLARSRKLRQRLQPFILYSLADWRADHPAPLWRLVCTKK